MIPGIFQAFRSRYPGVVLQLFEGSYAEVESWVKGGTVDHGFLAAPCDGLDMIPLVNDPYVAVLPANHQLRKHDVISIEFVRIPHKLLHPPGYHAASRDRNTINALGHSYRNDQGRLSYFSLS
ncbi:LysR family transcriptional regulator substrate-binding protein [Paenibacillus sp. R14(2021)]|uniref:LysR family transcriptional regulator substrate-binding protein n=1 Tax=Paenibacillus sp. R14(2021) TaxID=2859228 RepID=UPI002157D710|nr:LysR family transcriptional regulator substrate-binding protein [Paenibacillus sp. R14(2021)]